MPVLLRSFGARNELELIDRREAPDSVDVYRLSCTSREERPQFLTSKCAPTTCAAGMSCSPRTSCCAIACARPASPRSRPRRNSSVTCCAVWTPVPSRLATATVEHAVAARPARRREARRALLARGSRGRRHPARGSVEQLGSCARLLAPAAERIAPAQYRPAAGVASRRADALAQLVPSAGSVDRLPRPAGQRQGQRHPGAQRASRSTCSRTCTRWSCAQA